ncbi:MAG: hypothetical protein JWS10_3061 [Cypionkella sp.]|uniref:hypothetical protein n=1 Tax=Cypionkella sp. TaxID=2811411 RepID=UPI002607EC44|nr:hypothetical protein [Cypionkella sp.]MDB5660446.1 hypothetical protein [Cypionkella sp.]
MWRKLFAVMAAFGVATSAGAATYGYGERLHYDFTYYAPTPSISVLDHYNPQFRLASSTGETTGFSKMVTFGFALLGLQPDRLAGKTLNLSGAGLDSAFPDRVVETFYIVSELILDNQSGHVSFDSNENIDKWAYLGDRSRAGAVAFSTSNDPSKLILDRSASDPQNLNGSTIYDEYYFEPWDLFYSTRPGYWTTDTSKVCFTTENGEYLAAAECRSPSTVPLPASLPLLISAMMFGILFAQKRRGLTASPQS